MLPSPLVEPKAGAPKAAPPVDEAGVTEAVPQTLPRCPSPEGAPKAPGADGAPNAGVVVLIPLPNVLAGVEEPKAVVVTGAANAGALACCAVGAGGAATKPG